MPYPSEIDHLGICTPNKGIHIRFERLADKTLFTRFQIHDKQAVQISLVTVTLHALPGNILAVR